MPPSSRRGWFARGDGFHWDHKDGCFIEKELGTKSEFTLYTKKAERMGSAASLEQAQNKHRLVHK